MRLKKSASICYNSESLLPRFTTTFEATKTQRESWILKKHKCKKESETSLGHLQEQDIYINVDYIEQGNHTLNIVHKNKVVVQVSFQIK